MKTLMLAGLVLAISIPAYAQDVTSGSQSGSQSKSYANSSPHQAQQASAQATYAPTINEAPIPTNTSERIRNTPDVVTGAYAPSMAPDSCMTTAQVGVAVAGIGATAGKGVADEACRKLRAAEKRLQIVNAANVLRQPAVADYNLEQAEADVCMAEGYEAQSCQRVARQNVYNTGQ